MAGIVGLGAACDVVIYKDGESWDRLTFPQFFNSISKVSAKVKVEQMAEVTIELTPSMDDALLILGSGVLGASTGAAGQVPQPDGPKASASASSVGGSAGGGDKPATAPSNAPYYTVRFYYPGEEDAETDWYGGFAVTPDFSLNSGEISITLKIIGQHALMALSQGPKVYKNEVVLDVLKKLMATFGCEIAFKEGDTETEAKLSGAKISGQFNEPNESLVRRILQQQKCLYVKDTGGEGKKPRYLVTAIKYLHEQEPLFHFVALRQVEPEKNVYPVTSFELSSKGSLFFPGHTFGTYSRAVITSSKEVKKKVGSSTDNEGAATSGTKSDTGAFPEDTGAASEAGGATGKVDTSDPDETGSDVAAVGNKEFDTVEELNSRAHASRETQLVYRIETMGMPRVQPLSMVQFTLGPGPKGIEAFSGLFKVNSIEHTWDSSGWWTALEITKTGGAANVAATTEKEGKEPSAPDNKTAKKATKI